MKEKDKIETVTGTGGKRKFLKMSTKICPICEGATGGSRMGMVLKLGDTACLECEYCSHTIYLPLQGLVFLKSESND